MSDETYGKAQLREGKPINAPQLDYLPCRPQMKPKIGLIGAGGITEYHLRAYRTAGLDVVAIANPTLSKAESRRDEFYPQADIYADASPLLERDDIEIVDIATHPPERVSLIEQAIRSGKHILSQKPFVTDLDVGERLVDQAEEAGVHLAVNQNGRWAPHYRYAIQAVRAGLLGDIASVDFTQQWDHTWTVGTPFEEIHHLLLYDFAVHWFDFAVAFLNDVMPEQVFASTRRASYQKGKPPFLAHAVIDYPSAQVRINYNAHVAYAQQDQFVVCGEKGTLRSIGDELNIHSSTTLATAEGTATPKLEGEWFTNGFQGTMLELIRAIEEDRVPENNARANLTGLAICFAALRSADTGQPQKPGSVRRYD